MGERSSESTTDKANDLRGSDSVDLNLSSLVASNVPYLFLRGYLKLTSEL